MSDHTLRFHGDNGALLDEAEGLEFNDAWRIANEWLHRNRKDGWYVDMLKPDGSVYRSQGAFVTSGFPVEPWKR